MAKTKQWIDACETFNEAKLGHSINIDKIKLVFLKKNRISTELSDEEL